MRISYLAFLVWIAVRLERLAHKIFEHACAVAQDEKPLDKKESVTTEYAGAIEQAPKKLSVISEQVPLTISEPMPSTPMFTDTDHKPIPLSFDELPSPLVFKVMFERKYGVGGYCPLAIGGQPRMLTWDALYTMLVFIRAKEKVAPAQAALYGTIMAVILHGHGEELNPSTLN
jgi:hypothetical protein